MKATISMESLWQTIQSLSPKNKKWLADKLIEDLQTEEESIGKEEILAGIDAGLKEVKQTREGKLEEKQQESFCMNYKILVKPTFQREAKRMAKHYRSFAKDYETLIEALEQNPHLGTDLGGGLRKIRMAITSKGRGKSGGARVITFTVIAAVDETEINLLYIYDKAERENISSHEIEELLRKNGLG